MYFNSFNNCFILIINIIYLIHSSISKLIYTYNIFIIFYLTILYKINFRKYSNKYLFIFNEELLCWLPCPQLQQLIGNEYPLKKIYRFLISVGSVFLKIFFSSHTYIIKEVYCPNFALLSTAKYRFGMSIDEWISNFYII